MTPVWNVLTWATAVSTNSQTGRRIIFRYAEHLHPTFDQVSQPIRMIVVWKYESDNGMPNAEDNRRMSQLEDALESALERDCFATLAIVSTGEDVREWTYYARSENEFLARLNFALAAMSAFPIEVHSASDPNWDIYEQFRLHVLKSTRQRM